MKKDKYTGRDKPTPIRPEYSLPESLNNQDRKRERTLQMLIQGIRSLQQRAVRKRDQLRQLCQQQKLLLSELQELEIRLHVMTERLSQTNTSTPPEALSDSDTIRKLDRPVTSMEQETQGPLPNDGQSPHKKLRLVSSAITMSKDWMPSSACIVDLNQQEDIPENFIFSRLTEFRAYWAACGIERSNWQLLFTNYVIDAWQRHHL